jgi:lauroyl/myristoyl acyltransferase
MTVNNILRQLIELRQEYNVIGGEGSIIDDKEYTEEYHYKEYLSGILARRAKLVMFCIHNDNDETLPLCMVDLGEGHVATCYKNEEGA